MRHWYAVIDNGGNWRVDWVTEVENAVCFVPACGVKIYYETKEAAAMDVRKINNGYPIIEYDRKVTKNAITHSAVREM
jgi:hypothetical protein